MIRQKILVIDDDPFTHWLVTGHLAELSLDIVSVMTGEAGIQAAREQSPDLILLDLNLSDQSGFEVCDQLRNDPATWELPVIFLTGTDNADDKVRAFGRGAVDYVTKPFHPAELRARVRAALRTQALLEALEAQALSDALTKLPNRAALYRSLGKAIERARASDDPVAGALMFLDLDRFKLINDSLGHGVGDQLLIEVANRLHTCCRGTSTDLSKAKPGRRFSGDLVARMGGDEFAILLHDVGTVESVQQIASRLVAEVSRPVQIDEHSVVCGASIGIRMINEQCEGVEEAVRDADIAMYHAKSEGRGRFAFFNQAMHDEIVMRIELEGLLRHAVDRGELRVFYQPIINLSTGELEGFESLIRWVHPTRGLLSPDAFISVAEETGVIRQIGAWILEQSCRQAVEWQRTFGRSFNMHVNASKVQFTSESVVEQVKDIVAQAGIDPRRLVIEVTESTIMHDARTIVPCLDKLREAGIKLAMDDFGTGYSSLATLHRFPIDVLKIDREFVTRLKASRPYAAIVQAVVTLAHNLGLIVIAEGVEACAEVATLQALDCDCAQGYFFSKPVPAAEAEGYILSSVGGLKLAA